MPSPSAVEWERRRNPDWRSCNHPALQTVLVVVLLALDFWTVRNVSGRVLVGLRFWNQVDDDGTSFWVFESRSVSADGS